MMFCKRGPKCLTNTLCYPLMSGLYESFYLKTVLMLPIKTLHTWNLRLIHGKKQAKIYPNFLFFWIPIPINYRWNWTRACKILIIRAIHLINYLPCLTYRVGHGIVHLNSGIVILNKNCTSCNIMRVHFNYHDFMYMHV